MVPKFSSGTGEYPPVYTSTPLTSLKKSRKDKRVENNLDGDLIKRTNLQPCLPPPGDTPSERIRWARYNKNMTIKQVAGKASLHEPTVSRAENNKPIEIDSLKKLSIILEQPVWWLGCFENLLEHTLAQRITKARLYQGMTKREFAKLLGVDEKTVRWWESETSEPTAESMKLLSPYLTIINLSTHLQKFPAEPETAN